MQKHHVRTVAARILVGMALALGDSLSAHEEGAHFSGAIVDPLEVHHAHIEDEQRINFGSAEDAVRPDGTKKTAIESSLEIATAWDANFRWGTELFIPISNATGDGSLRVGDMELWALKHAFINDSETIMTGVLGLVVPTGNEAKGLGEGETFFAPHLLLDKARDNWFLGVNLATEINTGDISETDFDYSAVISYSWISGTVTRAATRPAQSWVPSLSTEFLGSKPLNGEAASTAILPGLNFWHTRSGWTLRTGVKIPLSDERENERLLMVQLGNHLNWSRLRK